VQTCHTLYLAVAGKGVLHSVYGDFPLERGCLFITFSAKRFYIENTDNLQYIYIGFLGNRADAILARLTLTQKNPVAPSCDFLIPLFERGVADINDSNVDLLCEGLLLTAFSHLCAANSGKIKAPRSHDILKVKEYIDLNYSNSRLSLQFLGEKFNYQSKYLSTAFYRLVRTSFSDYLQGLRLKQAVQLMENGFTSIQEIASMCGYEDPLYFSKVFKKAYGLSPKKYLSEHKK
jgi:AraC-like DNA-binding protein